MPSTGLDRDRLSRILKNGGKQYSFRMRDYWFSQSIGKTWYSFLILFYPFQKEKVSKKKISASVTVPASGCWYRGWGPTCNRHHSEQQRWLEKFSHDYAMATNFVADVVWSVSVLSVNVNSWQHSITKSWLRQSLCVYIFSLYSLCIVVDFGWCWWYSSLFSRSSCDKFLHDFGTHHSPIKHNSIYTTTIYVAWFADIKAPPK